MFVLLALLFLVVPIAGGRIEGEERKRSWESISPSRIGARLTLGISMPSVERPGRRSMRTGR